MDKLDIILWAMAGGFSIILTAMMFMWHALSSRMDRMDIRFDKIDHRFDKIEEKLNDLDRRLCRLEGAFASKDCCMIKDERKNKKVI